jgi:hypothetical protein
MSIGLLVLAALVGLIASAACYMQTRSPGLALLAYVISGTLTVTALVAAREICGSIRRSLRQSPSRPELQNDMPIPRPKVYPKRIRPMDCPEPESIRQRKPSAPMFVHQGSPRNGAKSSS